MKADVIGREVDAITALGTAAGLRVPPLLAQRPLINVEPAPEETGSMKRYLPL